MTYTELLIKRKIPFKLFKDCLSSKYGIKKVSKKAKIAIKKQYPHFSLGWIQRGMATYDNNLMIKKYG